MNYVNNITSFTASQARSDFYNLVKSASKGLEAFEITLRGSEPVVMLNKAEFESWMETIDILNNPVEVDNIKKARASKKTITHKEILKQLID